MFVGDEKSLTFSLTLKAVWAVLAGWLANHVPKSAMLEEVV
jgi:hypothetical protein